MREAGEIPTVEQLFPDYPVLTSECLLLKFHFCAA